MKKKHLGKSNESIDSVQTFKLKAVNFKTGWKEE